MTGSRDLMKDDEIVGPLNVTSFCVLESWQTLEARYAQESATMLVKNLGFVGKLSKSH